MSMNDYVILAEQTTQSIASILRQRGLDASVLMRSILVQDKKTSDVWLFVVLDDRKIQRIEQYIHPQTIHQISTALQGKPVIISNSTGIRYAVLLSAKKSLPDMVDYPGMLQNRFRIGVSRIGEVSISWNELGNMLIAGMTRYGKSNFLRLLAVQALSAGCDLYLIDGDGTTFPELRSSAIAYYSGPTGAASAAPMLAGLIRDRISSSKTVPRALVMIDEFNGLVQATGGTRTEFSQTITQLAWGGLKFGIHTILSGQTFEKAIVGPVRDQMVSRVCFRVMTPSTSRIVLNRSAAEYLKVPGRAITSWGLVQTYKCELPVEIHSMPIDNISQSERPLLERLRKEFNGDVTYAVLMSCGLSRSQAAIFRQDLIQRGLVKRGSKNALILASEPANSQTPQTVQTGKQELLYESA